MAEAHPDLGQSLNNLALLYKIQGRYAEAEALYKKALEVWEKALYPDDPAITTVLKNMKELYKHLGKQNEVIRLEKRLEEIRSHSNKDEELHNCSFQPLIVALIALMADLLTAGVKPKKCVRPLHKRGRNIRYGIIGVCPQSPNSFVTIS